MCGIAGRVNYRSGAPVDAGVLGAMCDLLQHRGPDGEGVWVRDAVGFGHRRLAVIDLSPAGHQPLHSVDGRLTITLNGEIYNYRELRRTLEAAGRRFASETDTEVVLEAYREFGVGCLERLRGMFAFAIWDHDRQRLFAARDRVGQKPFYYREDADGFTFASEPKAFLADPSYVPEADPQALFHYLSFQYVPSPGSAFRGLRRLPPAHYLVLERGALRVERYWTLRYLPKLACSADEADERLRALLEEAIRLQLVSDVPLGAFLSGGVDSSVVTALMSRVGGGRVKTFSIGFEEAEYNELPYARAVAEGLGADHHEAIVRPDAVSLLPALVWHYDEPFADSSAIPTFYLSEMTRRHVTVALTGDAGDESFAGYPRYLAARMLRWVAPIPLPLGPALSRAADLMSGPSPRTRRARLARLIAGLRVGPERRYAGWVFPFDDERKRRLCTADFLAAAGAEDSASRIEQLYAASDAREFVDATLDVDVHSYLPDDLLVKVDIATMAFGLEGRSPFLDHHVMEFAARLPPRFKLRRTEGKYLLKRLARQLVPPAVVDRPKMGFGVPLDHWFRDELRDMAHDVLLGPRARARGYFQMAVVERLLREHEAATHDRRYQLWSLLMFELWHRRFIDERPAAPRPSTVAVPCCHTTGA